MAHESFENEATAALMNANYVNIKVDREERPDIDGVYMTAVQALTGQGGWPMTVFMTPDGKPFYAGTYFPPEDGYGRPGFPRVLEAIAEKWRADRAEVLNSADSIVAHLRQASQRTPTDRGELTLDLADRAAETFRENFDAVWGGFGMAPKFPSPGNLEFLLAHATRTGDGELLEMVIHTLRRMATGGMYDQLGGGFARYSVDERWLVPHFEKMLYDNAQLVRVYLHAWQITREPLFERVVRETLAYLEREMLDGEGGFYAAQDADSEGIEGKYFVWTQAEIESLLGADAPLFAAYFGVTAEGNFRDPHHPELTGRNVLTNWQDHEALAERFGMPLDAFEAKVAQLRAQLFGRPRPPRSSRPRRQDPRVVERPRSRGVRRSRTRPRASPAGAQSLNATRPSCAQSCEATAGCCTPTRTGVPTSPGCSRTTRTTASGWSSSSSSPATSPTSTGRVSCSTSSPPRSTTTHSGASSRPPTAVNSSSCARSPCSTPRRQPATAPPHCSLSGWTATSARSKRKRYLAEVVGLVHDHLVQAATGFGSLLQAIEFAFAPHREVAIIGDPAARAPLERETARRYAPWLVVAPSTDAIGLPIFEGRAVDAGALAYVCENMACQLPVADVAALRAQLRP